MKVQFLVILVAVLALLLDLTEAGPKFKKGRGAAKRRNSKAKHRKNKGGKQPREWLYAMVHVRPDIGVTHSQVEGTVYFRQAIIGRKILPVEYKVNLSGFNVSDDITAHASHIHTYGTIMNGCDGAEGHYNPLNKSHSLPPAWPRDETPETRERELGDLANLVEDGSGNVQTTFKNAMVKLTGRYSILGRTFDVHERRDTGTGRSGNAGPKIACGVVVASNGAEWD